MLALLLGFGSSRPHALAATVGVSHCLDMAGRSLTVVPVLLALTACSGSESSPDRVRDEGTDPPPMALDECGLRTGYPGDEFCILPPPPDKGFQVHVGPTDYANPEPLYILPPGEEQTDTFSVASGNQEDVFFFYRQYRMRPGTHHLSLTIVDPTGESFGHIIGIANASQDFPAGGVVAPENRGIGSPLPASSHVDVSVHAINTSSAPALREVWINYWYRDPNEVTEPTIPWFNNGDPNIAIQPHTATTLGPYTCTVEGNGRLLWLYGHRHANNVRFTVTRVRGSRRDVIYDAYNWQHPLRLEYSSIVKNAAPDPDTRIDGGWSGILDLATGDRIEWQCDVVNNHDTVLRYTNETYLGEMCIIDAEAVRSTCT